MATAASIWRHRGVPSRAEAERAAVAVLEKWNGQILSRDDGDSDCTIEVSFPPLSAPPLRIFERLLPAPFSLISSLTVRLSDTDAIVRVETWGRTSFVLPALVALFAYVAARQVPWHPALLAPVIGLGIAAFYWFLAWVQFDSTTRALIKRMREVFGSAGA